MAQKSVAIAVALESELRHLLKHLEDRDDGHVGPWRVHRGRIGGQRVIALHTGIGLVNAAAALATLISSEPLAAIVNYGCAGAHRSDVLPGDVVVRTSVVAHGSMVMLPDGREQYAGFRYAVNGELIQCGDIPADPALLAAALEVRTTWRPVRWPWADPGTRQPMVLSGVVASADCWTQHGPRLEALHKQHESLCEDMEAAALAQVAALHQIPFLAVKDISNNEFLSTTRLGENFPTLAQVREELGARAFAVVMQMLARADRARALG